MPVKLRTKRPDRILKQIVGILERYQEKHPEAEIEAYRQNSVSVRIRIIDPGFQNQSRAQREEAIWELLNGLAEDVAAEISLLLLLTPEEAPVSLASLDFDDPVVSRL